MSAHAMSEDGPRSGDHRSEPEQPPAVLASDAERDQSVELLRSAVVDGRLTLEEFTGRVELAQAARTDLELAALSRDLPAARPGAAAAPSTTALSDAPAAERHRAVCSRISRSGPWSLPAHGSYSSIFGTIDLDLRQARLSADVTELDVFNLFGTVTVIVPEGVEVSVDGGGLFASQVIDSPQVPPVRDAPQLRIHASGPGGTLYVRSKPPAGRLEKLLGTARAVRELHGGRGDNPER
jgi:Domain of unknown function (DUF1707)/Cell wall-active antibiotics response 4TMS YvqF